MDENKAPSETGTAFIVRGNDISELIKLKFGYVRAINGLATFNDYLAATQGTDPNLKKLGFFSFELPEERSFSGAEIESFEIAYNSEINVKTQVHVRQGLWSAVYESEQTGDVELIGKPDKISEYSSRDLVSPKIIQCRPLQTFVTIPLPVPIVKDEIADVAARRYLFRLAASILNKFTDDFRAVTNPAWITNPHYSFGSFGDGIYTEYSVEGKLILAEKFLLNPSRIHSGIVGHVIDPHGTARAELNKRLLDPNSGIDSVAQFKKGQAYFGQGEYLMAFRVCVSAIEDELRKFFAKKGFTYPKGKSANNMRLKDYRGKFEEYARNNKLFAQPHLFFPLLDKAIQIRHDVEHEMLYDIRYEELSEKIVALEKYFFTLVAQK